jgi:predicted phage tail protein
MNNNYLLTGFLVLVLSLSGCFGTGAVQTVSPSSPQGQSLIQSLTAKINEKQTEADAAKDKLDKLKLELEAKQLERDKLKQQLVDNDKETQVIKGQIKAEKDARLALKLYLTAGGLGAAALLLVVLGVWLAKPSFFYGAVACAAGAAVATVFAWLVPYLLYLAGGVVLILAAIMAYMLIHRHTTLTQVVTAVEGFKSRMPGYKEHFDSIIDDSSDALITSIRGKLALKNLTTPAAPDPRGATTVVTKAVEPPKTL